MLSYSETPVEEMHTWWLREAGVRLLVKREDLNHPHVSGNKWWKLKYNLAAAQQSGVSTVLTFGGAYSNHIFATTAAAKEIGLRSIGIIRGEETLPLNHTLQFARERGMHLQYVSREMYRQKNDPAFIQHLHEQHGDFYLIPEGGTNTLALRGCVEWGQQLFSLDFDYLFLPIGTGGTLAGIVLAAEGRRTIKGISTLKGDFLKDDVQKLITDYTTENFSENKITSVYGNWEVLTSYHHGGYAKVTLPLLEFVKEMREEHSLPLDPVYTGKLLWAVREEVMRGSIRRGSTILALHTGGLQGVYN